MAGTDEERDAEGGPRYAPAGRRGDRNDPTPDGRGGRRSGDPLLSANRWVAGGILGGMAFAGGYALTLVALATGLSGRPGAPSFAPDATTILRYVGWIHYNAHFVGVVEAAAAGEGAVNVLADPSIPLGTPRLVFYAIPAAVLVLAGAAAGEASPVGNRLAGAARGVAVAAGYLPFAVAGALMTAQNGFRPDLVDATLLAGIAYPVVFGGIGGLLGAWIGRGDGRDGSDGPGEGSDPPGSGPRKPP